MRLNVSTSIETTACEIAGDDLLFLGFHGFSNDENVCLLRKSEDHPQSCPEYQDFSERHIHNQDYHNAQYSEQYFH